MYFIFDEDDWLIQTVCFAPVKESSEPRPYMYYEYIGGWHANPIATAICVPTVTKPSLKQRMDLNVYDAQGRVVNRATNTQDPFSGLPRGLYFYQGKKYIKR